ncbi:MAG TPA: hypothetical protein VGW34_01655 [Allosphingosinicella sp.]|nr:hypothetical protein [Allosphingosinicella sp.]
MIFRAAIAFCIALALLLVPAGMTGGGTAMAAGHDMAAAAAMEHCADEQMPPQDEAPDTCCVVTCVAIAAIGGEMGLIGVVPTAKPWSPLAVRPDGLDPAADTPPPRVS